MLSSKFSRLATPYSTKLNSTESDSTLFSEMLSEKFSRLARPLWSANLIISSFPSLKGGGGGCIIGDLSTEKSISSVFSALNCSFNCYDYSQPFSRSLCIC